MTDERQIDGIITTVEEAQRHAIAEAVANGMSLNWSGLKW